MYLNMPHHHTPPLFYAFSFKMVNIQEMKIETNTEIHEKHVFKSNDTADVLMGRLNKLDW